MLVLLVGALLTGCSSDDDGSGIRDPGGNPGIDPGDNSGVDPDVDPNVDPGGDSGGELPLIGTILSSGTVAAPAGTPSAGRVTRLRHAMRGVVDGRPTEAGSLLFEPSGAAPAAGWPLVAWAHGTTGLSDACAPSADYDALGYSGATERLLAAGFAVLAPDYEGLGAPGLHPYYVRASHAASVVDAVRAVYRLDDVALTDGWTVVGHSQGGHVALATARAEPLPGHPLHGAVALAPGTDLGRFSEIAFAAIDRSIAAGDRQQAAERLYYLNVYGAYVAHALALVQPAFEPRSVFGETVAPLIGSAPEETRCGSYADAVADALNAHLASGAAPLDFAGLRREWYTDPLVAERLELERLGDEPQTMPLLVIQGEADRQVPLLATDEFVEMQRSLGTELEYVRVPNARHGDVVLGEMARTIAFLERVFGRD